MFSLIIGNLVAACSSVLTNPFRHLSRNNCLIPPSNTPPPHTHVFTHTYTYTHDCSIYRHRKAQVYLSNTKKPIGAGGGADGNAMTTHFSLLYFSAKTLDTLLLDPESKTYRDQIRCCEEGRFFLWDTHVILSLRQDSIRVSISSLDGEGWAVLPHWCRMITLGWGAEACFVVQPACRGSYEVWRRLIIQIKALYWRHRQACQTHFLFFIRLI